MDDPMSLYDFDESSNDSDSDSMVCDTATNNKKPVDEVAMRRASALYHLLVRSVY